MKSHLALVTLGLLLAAPPAFAQEDPATGVTYPAPPEGWWELVSEGDTAVYTMTMFGREAEMTLRVKAVNEQSLDLQKVMSVGGQAMMDRTRTMEIATDFSGPPGIDAITKEGEETLTIDGVDYVCTIYAMEKDGGTIRSWVCPDVPPQFNGGSVKTQINEPSGKQTNLVLVSLETAKPYRPAD